MIIFTEEQWEAIRKTYRAWWSHEIDRPVICPNLFGDGGKEPAIAEPIAQKHFGDTAFTSDQIAERICYDTARRIYKADAYPMANMDCTGPGVVAAYLGAELSLSSEGMIWFHPMKNRPEIESLHLIFDENNFWYKRTVDIIRKVKVLSGGNMVLGFPDLGGAMDVLSAFLPSEELFFAMADCPEEVRRLLLEVETAWFAVYDSLFKEFEGFKGYSNWSGIYSDRKSYIHQCDFSYMIGPDDFDEFVLPTLKREFSLLSDSIYHLDGKGEIKHLDKLLTCENLQAVQWVPGDGNGMHEDYPELLTKILNSGRGTYVWGDYDNLKKLKATLGTLKGIYMRYDLQPGEDFDKSFVEFTK